MLRRIMAAGLALASTAALADSKTDCLNSKDHDLRIKSCSAIIQHNPKDVIAYHNRGEAYGLKGDHDRAIADYTKAIEINPSYAPAYTSRGRAYTSKGDYVHAVADVTRAGELAPKPVPKLKPTSAAVKAAPHTSKQVAKPGPAASTQVALPTAGMAAPADKPNQIGKSGPAAAGNASADEKPSDGSWPAWANRLKN